MSPITEYAKTLTKTDVGAPTPPKKKGDPPRKSKQQGILVEKGNESLFAKLDKRKKNPRQPVTIEDWTGKAWTFEFVYFNSYAKPNKSEFRLTGVNDFQKKHGIAVGTRIRFWRDGSGLRVEVVVPGSDVSDVEQPDESRGLPEGAKSRVEVNRYERSKAAKRKCLATHGRGCACCEMMFAAAYGKKFEKIIHVHHLTPISKVGERYEIDPVRDLRPVCPNCHAVIHQDPKMPLSINDVRALLGKAPLIPPI